MSFLRPKPNKSLLLTSMLLIIVAALAYLVPLSQASIYRDDWYYTVDRLKGGPETFHEMFSIDRPARGYFFEAYYRLFGVNPAPYHLVSFVLRIASGLVALWLFRLLWPMQREAALMMSLLFILYPGYTHWMEGFENQPNIFSLFLAVTSILLTLQALETSHPIARGLLWSASILSGIGYLLLIDYAIGTEVFRFLCVFLWATRDREGLSLTKKGLAALRAWAPAALIPGLYLFWRLFIFSNQRPETDVALQFGQLLESPLQVGLTWLLNFLRSVFNQSILAWWSPHFQDFFAQRNREIFVSLLIAIIGTACVAGVLFWMQRRADRAEHITAVKGAIWIGSLGVAAGVLPIIAANRIVNLAAFSHYALPASLASAVLLGGLACAISSPRMRLGLIALLVFLAIVSHTGVSASVLNEEAVITSFWQQLAWRVPGIRPSTTLTVSYPGVNYGEDVDAVNGPANFIYYPEPSDTLPVYYPLYAVKQSFWTAKQLLSEKAMEVGYRTHYGLIDPASMLVISQPAPGTCVHIINSRYPWYSYNDPDFILLAGRYSNIERVLTDSALPKLDESIFGQEPARDWCYYFEQAELALQRQDWASIRLLGEEATALGLRPRERLEWMPFLQAYAILDNGDAFAQTASQVHSAGATGDVSVDEAAVIAEYNRRQACSVLESMQNAGWKFSSNMQARISELLCW